ncbi:hypothetical protein QFC19_006751 [Naganishia cerealis]|uniref:Uncharacterized protein n=1 Tax=Naganishia cerealis TaxID=610337 RepID=A0ACC2VFW5_9TREE|nr:hypothetical protein QFC19_006751 [Naganishia cerealis]
MDNIKGLAITQRYLEAAERRPKLVLQSLQTGAAQGDPTVQNWPPQRATQLTTAIRHCPPSPNRLSQGMQQDAPGNIGANEIRLNQEPRALAARREKRNEDQKHRDDGDDVGMEETGYDDKDDNDEDNDNNDNVDEFLRSNDDIDTLHASDNNDGDETLTELADSFVDNEHGKVSQEDDDDDDDDDDEDDLNIGRGK